MRFGQIDMPWERVGGPMAMVWAGTPTIAFAVVSWLAGVAWGISVAVACALLLAFIRFIRNGSMVQPAMGLFAVCAAALVTVLTGDRRDYFSIGIWMALGGAVLMTVSIMVRVPLVGLVWELLRGAGFAWRKDPSVVRRYSWAALIWIAIYLSRFVVQFALYQADEVGWLTAARLIMGWPLFAVGVFATALFLWRSEKRTARSDPSSLPA